MSTIRETFYASLSDEQLGRFIRNDGKPHCDDVMKTILNEKQMELYAKVVKEAGRDVDKPSQSVRIQDYLRKKDNPTTVSLIMSQFLMLPDTAIVHILGFCDLNTVLNAQKVCRKLNDIVEDSTLKAEKTICDSIRIFHQNRNVLFVVWKVTDCEYQWGMAYLNRKYPSMKSIMETARKKTLKTKAFSWQTLNVTQDRLVDFLNSDLNLSVIENIKFDDCECEVDDSQLMTFLKELPSLTSVEFDDCLVIGLKKTILGLNSNIVWSFNFKYQKSNEILSLNDGVLAHWAKRPPKKLSFVNTVTSFTRKGMAVLVKSDVLQYNWTFGFDEIEERRILADLESQYEVEDEYVVKNKNHEAGVSPTLHLTLTRLEQRAQ